MNHCVDCLYWDEEKLEEDGLAPCLKLLENDSPLSAENHCCGCSMEHGNYTAWVPGDFGCVLFSAKLAKPRQSDEPVRE